MKVELLQENLKKALSHINKAVSARPNIPVLANVLLETEKGRIKLAATNLEIGITTWVGATVTKEGTITVSAKLLSDFINSLKPGKIELMINDNKLLAKSVDNKAEFFMIPAEEFPQIPQIEGKASLGLDAEEFADAVSRTAFAASTDESRPVLTGVLFNVDKKQLTLVGVDGFRLSKKNIKLNTSVTDSINEIIPASALQEVERLIRDVEEEKIEIYLMSGKNQVLFKIGDIEFSTRLIEGKFPDYEQILPDDKELTFKMDKKEFVDMLKVVSIFARNVVGNKAKANVNVEEKELVLTANVIDVGSNESRIAIKNISGDDLETGFNVKFLSDMVSAIKGEEIIFESKGATSPGVFKDPADKDFVHVVMPMRLE